VPSAIASLATIDCTVCRAIHRLANASQITPVSRASAPTTAPGSRATNARNAAAIDIEVRRTTVPYATRRVR
jgi:hypothetical protein